MIQVFIDNSIDFLTDLAAWLVTPVPLAFIGLFILGEIFHLVRRLSDA